MPQILIASCPYADSLLGAEVPRGKLHGQRLPNSQVILTSGADGRTISGSVDLHVTVFYVEHTAPRDPHGMLRLMVLDDSRLARAMTASDTNTLTLVLDDSVTLNLGVPRENPVTGASRASFLPLNTNLSRTALLALARAGKAKALIASRSYGISRNQLREVNGLYRVAVWVPPDSIPLVQGLRVF